MASDGVFCVRPSGIRRRYDYCPCAQATRHQRDFEFYDCYAVVHFRMVLLHWLDDRPPVEEANARRAHDGQVLISSLLGMWLLADFQLLITPHIGAYLRGRPLGSRKEKVESIPPNKVLA